MKTYLLIDGNNLAFRVYFALKHSKEGLLKTSTNVPTTIIYGILNSLNVFTRDNEVDNVIIAWDCGKSIYKTGIMDIYKGQRDHSEHLDLFEEMNIAQAYLKQLGLFSFIVPGIEADEIIGYLSTRLVEEGSQVIIFSDDSDFYQLKKKNIKIWKPVKNKFITDKDILEKFKVKARQIPALLAVVGSKKDNIPGICNVESSLIKSSGLGMVGAVKLLAPVLNGTIDLKNYIRTANVGGRWGGSWHKHKKQMLKSYKLAKIRTKKFNKEEEEKLAVTYSEWHQYICSEVQTGLMYKKAIKVFEYLEIKSINVVKLLKRIGTRNEERKEK